MVVGSRTAAELAGCCLLVLTACTLDASGVGSGGSTGSGDGSTDGSGPSTTMTSPATTTMPTTTGMPDDSSGPTTPTTDDGSDEHGSDEHGSESDESTGEPLRGAFGDVVAVDELNSFGIDDDPTLTGDMLEIYFSSTRDGHPTEDIYRATRGSVDDTFEDVGRVEELSRDDSADASAELSADGLLIRFSGHWPGSPGGNDPMIAWRGGIGQVWSAPMRTDELTTASDEASVVVTDDALIGYFCRDFGGGPYWDILRITRAGDGNAWQNPTPADALNGDGRDCAPWVNADDTELWFTSVRPGGLGGEDIWRVAVDDGVFGEPEPVVELNTIGIDEDPWLSPDGNTIFFASDRGDGFEIYTATRE